MSVAFVFPGQGSQSVGMQAGLPDAHPTVSETYEQAADVLGYDLWQLVQAGPAEKLDETVVTQPAMLTAGIATWRAWQAAGGATPAMMAGHSLGEYTALVASGVLDFNDALRLVMRRAELMQNAVPPEQGAMAAILGLSDDEVIAVCEQASEGEIAQAANFNSPGQVVVAGDRSAIERVTNLAKEAGARRAIMLAVSVPSHTSLMQSAGDALVEAIEDTEFGDPLIPIICAVDGTPYGDANDIRSRIGKQVYSPVRWVATVEHMTANGIATIVECGPGKVLTGLIRRIDRSIGASCIDSADAFRETLDGVNS